MVRHASPAFSGSMPFKRNIIEGYNMLPALSPTSWRAPAQAARSPSPEPSMKMPARTARRPALVSSISALMRRVEPAEPIDAIKQLGRDALHHPMHLAKNIGVQPAEIRDTRRGAHAAEEPITLDQQRAAARARRSHGGSDAGGPAAQHDDLIFAIQRHLPRGLFDGFAGQVCGFLIVGGDDALAEEF